jgi:hypothetical protein
MVVIRTYTKFREIIRAMGDGESFAEHIEEIKQGALRITEAILYVKQHSINCVAAAMYAMTRFDPLLFPPEEAWDFVSQLFLNAQVPSPEDAGILRTHIVELYAYFLKEGKKARSWEEPLLDFLRRRNENIG